MLPRGIVSVVQTAFDATQQLDLASTRRLVDDALAAGVDGFLVPAVASEVAFLSAAERRAVVAMVAERARGRVPILLGASADTPAACAAHAAACADLAPAATLVAVPAPLYARPAELHEFFLEIARRIPGPLVIQDLEFNGPGLTLAAIRALREAIPQLVGLKIETAPAGFKYTAVREACGPEFWISGGWAVPQMIEALDRGADAMVPESAMIRVYKAIESVYRKGDRAAAVARFRELLPVLAFTNQELATSVAFFKRLLVRKGLFATAAMRLPLPGWDATSDRVAEELIAHYLALEASLASMPTARAR